MKISLIRNLAAASIMLALVGCNVSDDPAVGTNNGANNGTNNGSNNRVDPCEDGPAFCNDHGDCVVEMVSGTGAGGGSDSLATCECDEGYIGDNCEVCDEGYVQNDDGECVVDACAEGLQDNDDDGTCEDTCATAALDCGQGTCSDESGTAACVCNDGWTGDACDACESGKVELPAGPGTCVDDLCADAPCNTVDNATADSCAQTTADIYTCECGDGYLWTQDATNNAWICEPQCTDGDTDGYGDGPACLGADCLDSNGSVWMANQQTILKAEITGGGTTASVTNRAPVSVDFDYLFTRDTACPTCTTKVMAFYYSDATHYIPAGCVVTESAPLACEAGGTAAAITTNVSSPNQAGVYELRYVEYSDAETNCNAAFGALETEMMSDVGTKFADVTVTDTPACYPRARRITNTSFNGQSAQRYVATPGQTVRLTGNYATSSHPTSCPTCVEPLRIGWEGNPIGCPFSSVPAQCTSTGGFGTSGTFDFTFTAPTAPGIYPLRWSTSWVYNCTDVGFGNIDPSLTWGVLEVQ